MTCPQEPIPLGWRVWRGAVPTPLTQFAIDIRDHINQYAYGAIASTTSYNGQTVAAFKSHHVWTYRKMSDGTTQLVTGLCIPGCSLLVPVAAGTQGIGGTEQDSLATPDPTAAVYGVDPGAPASTNWPLVLVSGVAITATIAAFILAIKLAGRPGLP